MERENNFHKSLAVVHMKYSLQNNPLPQDTEAQDWVPVQ